MGKPTGATEGPASYFRLAARDRANWRKMDRGRVAIALVCAGIVLTVVVWVVLAALAGKLFL